MSPTFREHMDDNAESSRLTANDSKEFKGIVNIIHPIVTKKRKFMNLTRDQERNTQASRRSAAGRVREKPLILREPQNTEMATRGRGSRIELTGETSEDKSISRDSLVFVPEVVKVEKPAPPESWGEDDETPTQPTKSDEDLPLIYERTSESLEYAKPSNPKVTDREGLSPVEEYIAVVERLIEKGKLSPRSTEVLRRNVNRYKLTLRETGAGQVPIIESAGTSQDTTFLKEVTTEIKKLIPDFLNIFSSESDQELPTEHADSVIPLATKSTEAMAVEKTSKKSKKLKPSSSSHDTAEDESVPAESDRSTESIKELLEEITKEKERVEAENREIRSTVLTKFKESLKDSCNLESFTIEDPFSDFSLHNMQHDAVLKERIIQSQQEESMVSVDDEEYEDQQDSEPSTSKIRRRVHYEGDEKEQEKQKVLPDPLRSGDDSLSDEILLSSGLSQVDSSEKTYLDDSTQEPAVERYRIDELRKESFDQMEIMETADSTTLPSISDTTVADDIIQMENDGYAIESEAGTSEVRDKTITDELTIITDKIEDPGELKVAADSPEPSASSISKLLRDNASDKTAMSQKKRCAKCGMRVFETEKGTNKPTLAVIEEKNKKHRMKSEHDRSFTRKKSAVRCKCGCVGMVENEDDSNEKNPVTVMRCILNYFFPLATEYLVPRQMIKIIFNGCL